MDVVAKSGIFEGPIGKAAFSSSLHMYAEKKYEEAGRLVQWSVVNGGPGIPVLSDSCYRLLTGCGLLSIGSGLEDLTNDDVKMNLIKVYV
jgi:hypothetical protein